MTIVPPCIITNSKIDAQDKADEIIITAVLANTFASNFQVMEAYMSYYPFQYSKNSPKGVILLLIEDYMITLQKSLRKQSKRLLLPYQ